MNYAIHDCHSIPEEIRRIAEEQVSQALSQNDDPSLGDDQTIYALRKMCKRMRGLLRLCRSPLERGAKMNHYQVENARFRDMARALSDRRDADALGEAFEKLIGPLEGGKNTRGLATVRKSLQDRKSQVGGSATDLRTMLEATRRQLVDAAEQIPKWSKRVRSIESLLAGLSQNYARAHKAMDKAYKLETDEGFHEWRKRVKYHRYHCFLMHQSWPAMMLARRDELKRLSDALGDEHDLSVLKLVVTGESIADNEIRDWFLALMDRKQAELRASAHALGERLFTEPPRAFADRMAAYCRTWEETSEGED